ncbi:hypothetical protein EV424DRAFT_1573313 [Suillus variegatus]|nr:hypothetical protein EV424DRAFT_1573313 [Suillus variegatus]
MAGAIGRASAGTHARVYIAKRGNVHRVVLQVGAVYSLVETAISRYERHDSLHRSQRLVDPTIARREEDPDWNFYYVNMFVDRDMFMQFRGGAVGHKAMQEWDNILQWEGHIVEDLESEADEDIEMEDEDSSDEELDEGDIEEGDESDEGDENEDEDDDDDDDEDEDEDRIIAEYGEVLDDDILIEEGYGAL